MADLSGIDLCAYPVGPPPEGKVSNFDDPPSLAPVIIAVCAIMTALDLLVAGGRLYANRKQLAWSDYLAAGALACSIADTAVMLSQQMLISRHEWDVRVCWLLGDSVKVFLARTWLMSSAMLFAKASVFFLFRQIFTVERRRRIAIWAGLVATFLQSAATVAFQSYTLTPDPGKTWDDAALNSKAERMGGSWWIANAALYIALDLYVLLLPLPIIVRLNWSTKKRLKALAVFSTGLLAVAASILSLAYRVRMAADISDKTWKGALVLLCFMVEVYITIIVSSMPGFSKFMRVCAARKAAGNESADNGGDPNRPRTKRERYIELSDSWLFKSNATTEVSADTTPGLQPTTAPGVVRTLDVEQSISGPLPANVVIVRGLSGYDIYQDKNAPEREREEAVEKEMRQGGMKGGRSVYIPR